MTPLVDGRQHWVMLHTLTLGTLYKRLWSTSAILSTMQAQPQVTPSIFIIVIVRTQTMTFLMPFLANNITQSLNAAWSDVDINQACMTVNVRLNNRIEIYMNSQSARNNILSDIANRMMNKLGLSYPVIMSIPLPSALDQVYLVKVFLDNIFNAILVFLLILSVMLIFSLMLAVP